MTKSKKEKIQKAVSEANAGVTLKWDKDNLTITVPDGQEDKIEQITKSVQAILFTFGVASIFYPDQAVRT